MSATRGQLEMALAIAAQRADRAAAERLQLEIGRALLAELQQLSTDERRCAVELFARDASAFAGEICRAVLAGLGRRSGGNP